MGRDETISSLMPHLLLKGVEDVDCILPVPLLHVDINQDVVRHEVGLAALVAHLGEDVARQVELVGLDTHIHERAVSVDVESDPPPLHFCNQLKASPQVLL